MRGHIHTILTNLKEVNWVWCQLFSRDAGNKGHRGSVPYGGSIPVLVSGWVTKNKSYILYECIRFTTFHEINKNNNHSISIFNLRFEMINAKKSPFKSLFSNSSITNSHEVYLCCSLNYCLCVLRVERSPQYINGAYLDLKLRMVKTHPIKG